MNAGRRSWAAAAAFADPIRFPGRRMGPATPGQVRSARAAAGYRLFLSAAACAASPFALLFLVTITRGDLTSGPITEGRWPRCCSREPHSPPPAQYTFWKRGWKIGPVVAASGIGGRFGIAANVFI